MKKTIEVRFIKFSIPAIIDGKVKKRKVLHIQSNKRVGSMFLPPDWQYLYETDEPSKKIPKLVTNKKEGLEFVAKHSGIRNEQLEIMVYPTLSKVHPE